MTTRVGKMITLFIVAAAISGCLFWQGPLLSAPSSADSKEQFEASVKIAPSLAEAHYNLGMVLYRQGKDAEAKRHFLQAAALAPENDVIQSAPPFGKVAAPSRPSGSSGMSDGHGGHSH